VKLRFYSYPWQVCLPGSSNSADATTASLPVASGASMVVPTGDDLVVPFPEKLISVNGSICRVVELPDTDLSRRLSNHSRGDYNLNASNGAYGGLSKNDNLTEKYEPLNQFIEDNLRFVQRLDDIVNSQFPEIVKVHVPRVQWATLIDILSNEDGNEGQARKPLIVKLAEHQLYPLREIARGAKRVLRRRRDMERLSKAREFDKASLIRIAQMPGRTIAEKAGPRQRIPAIRRFESTDTLENRVVEHFCRLAQQEWRRTQANSRTKLGADWVQVASTFSRFCGRVRQHEDFVDLPKLKSPCVVPNYTLEQNSNYRAIWIGYNDLLKREEEREICWAWVRRLFLNRALVFASALFESAFPSASSAYVPYRKDLRVRKAQKQGLWVESESLPGPRVNACDPNGQYTSAYFLSPLDLRSAFGEECPLLCCNADAYYLVAGGNSYRCCPVYGFVGNTAYAAAAVAYEDLNIAVPKLKRLIERESGLFKIQTALFLWADLPSRLAPNDSSSHTVLHAQLPVESHTWVAPTIDITSRLRGELLR